MIIITGDHGMAYPPLWKGKNYYAHFEQHVRTPLIIKYPDWLEKKPSVIDEPSNATLCAFQEILFARGIDTPDYIKKLPQNNDDYKKYAITETIFHPEQDNYGVTLVSREIKYWMFGEVNWENCTFRKIIDEKLFLVAENGHVNEEINVINEYPEQLKIVRPLAVKFIADNLEFQKSHPTINFPDTINV